MRAFRFTDSAEKDVDAILAYTITTWGDAQAEAYIGGLYQVLALIAEKPAIGRLRPELAPGLRSFPYREHLVFYMLFEDAVLVIRVLAARQDIGTGLLET
ncbi:type II toxin-antitoxin system RelE/ParE family toxin [Shinella sp. S4-D37]|uniref:type II toxin-antitoxin system RelE/ParE family toxin n=1 Tax=Shinella sp. S4-D37 TaxID=3161999 RepID=UPI00346665D2